MKRDADEAVAALMKPMKREDVTDLIAFRKLKKAIKWAEVARKVGQAKEWTTAACLGQMQMTKKQAETVGRIFDLPQEAVLILQTVPYKGSLPTAMPTLMRPEASLVVVRRGGRSECLIDYLR